MQICGSVSIAAKPEGFFFFFFLMFLYSKSVLISDGGEDVRAILFCFPWKSAPLYAPVPPIIKKKKDERILIR